MQNYLEKLKGLLVLVLQRIPMPTTPPKVNPLDIWNFVHYGVPFPKPPLNTVEKQEKEAYANKQGNNFLQII